MSERSFFAVHRVRPADLDWKLFSPLKMKFRAYVPGLEAAGDIFARTNLSMNFPESTLLELEKICPRPGTATIEEYQSVVGQIRSVLPPDLHSVVEPGLRFGPPEVTSARKVVIDIFDFGVVSARLEACWQAAGIEGVDFYDVKCRRKANNCPDLFAMEASFAGLEPALQDSLAEQPFSRRKLPGLTDVNFLVGQDDIYRLPSFYGGFLFSQAAVEALRDASINLRGVEFQQVETTPGFSSG